MFRNWYNLDLRSWILTFRYHREISLIRARGREKIKEGMYTFHNFWLSKCKFTLNFDVQTQIWCGCDINALFCINFNLIMVYVNHKCFFNQMMAISHPFTSCINWNELGTLMDRVCSFSCVKDVYLFSMKVQWLEFYLCLNAKNLNLCK